VVAGDARALMVPASLLRDAGILATDDVICTVDQGELRLRADRLRRVYVEATTRCNLECTTCIRHSWDESLTDMPMARYEQLLEGLPASEPKAPTSLAFAGFGEPLAHPGFLGMVRLAAGRGHRVEVISNGTLLDAAAARELVSSGAAQVTVSIDGGDDASHRGIRGGEINRPVAALHALLAARLRRRAHLAVGLAAVATAGNVGSLPELLRLASDLRLDFVSISNVVPHTAELAGSTLWDRAAWASVFRAGAWRPRLHVARLDLDERTRPLADAITAVGLTFPSPSLDGHAWRNHCRFVHEGMLAVAADGRVAPCLSLLHTHTEHINSQARVVHALVVGHIDETPLAEIWQVPAYREFRRRLRAFDFPPCFHCGGCPSTEDNLEDCYRNPFPVCGECLWAQGLVLCP